MQTNYKSSGVDLGSIFVSKSEAADSAGKLNTARIISLSGSASGQVSFDGSEDVTMNVTVNYVDGTIDAASITSGIIDIARIPASVLDRLFIAPSETARYALTKNEVQNGDVVKQNDTGVMYKVVDDTKLNQAAGYVAYTVGSVLTISWDRVINTPTKYAVIQHLHSIAELAAGPSDRDVVPVYNGISGEWELTNANTLPGTITLEKPSITSPTEGQLGVGLYPTITATNLVGIYQGNSISSTEWVLATNASFTNNVIEVTNSATSVTITEKLLTGVSYFAKMRYRDTFGVYTQWSDTVSFTTALIEITTPEILSPVEGGTSPFESLVILASTFQVDNGGDTHVSTDWQVAIDSEFSNIVWQIVEDNLHKTSITMPTGILTVNNTYYLRARYKGSIIGNSNWSEVRSFVTPAEFSTDIVGGVSEIFNSGYTDSISITKLTDTKVIVTYRDASNNGYGTAIVLDINGTTITSGNEFVFNSGNTDYISITKLTDTKAIVAYRDNSDNNGDGTAIVLDINGATITRGNEFVFNSGGTEYTSITKLSDTKAIVVYMDGNNRCYGTAIVLGINGTAITSGNEYVFNSGNINYTSITTLTDTKAIVAYKDNGNSGYGTAIVLDINGTTITKGNEFVFYSGNTNYTSITTLTDTKAIVTYQDASNNNYGTAIVLDINGTSITSGNEFVFNSGDTYSTLITKLTDTKAIVAYRDDSNSYYGTAIVLDINGTSITKGNKIVFNSGSTSYISITTLTDTKAIVAYRDGSNSGYGATIVLTISTNPRIKTPEPTFPINNDTVGETPRMEATAFETVDCTDIHLNTDWQVATDSGFSNIIWQSLNDTVNKEAVIMAPGYLQDGNVTYYWRCRYRGKTYGTTAWSTTRSFKTIPVFGDIWAGAAEVFNSGTTEYTSITKLTDTKAIVAYRDNDYYGTAIVLDTNGTSITSGNEFVFHSGNPNYTSITKLTDTKAIVAYNDNNGYGTAVVLDINGTTITRGNRFIFNNGDIIYTSITKLTDTKAIVAYQDNSSYGTAIVLDINGTTITSGDEYVFNNGTTTYISITKLTDTKAIVAYQDGSNSGYGIAIVLDINGTSITSGNKYVFNSGATHYTSIAKLTDTKAIVAYADDSNNGYGTARVLDINGTVITGGNEFVFNSGGTEYTSITTLTDTKAIVAYQDNSNYGTVIVLDINGTVITKGNGFVFNIDSTFHTSITRLTDTKAIVAYSDDSNSYYGTAKVLLI